VARLVGRQQSSKKSKPVNPSTTTNPKRRGGLKMLELVVIGIFLAYMDGGKAGW
jgi:hypothetical protein